MEPLIYTLSNGIPVLHFDFPDAEVAHCAFLINSGTRDEPEARHGIAHFTEHAVFKGTVKRKAFHILSRIDSVGGELNAYTAKEETALHASFPVQHTARSIELLADILLHSTFPEKEIEKERAVILDEISSYQDSPSEQIFDDFEEQIFHGHPISKSILGTPDSLSKIGKQEIAAYFHDNYTTGNMLFTYSGPAKPAAIKKLLEIHLEGLRTKTSKSKRKTFKGYRPTHLVQNRPVNLGHLYLGNVAYHQNHPDRVAFVLLNNLLGGPGMNSRLNLNIREKYGFAYTIESGYTSYSDTGNWGIYAATETSNLRRIHELILRELRKLRDKKLGTLQLSQARHQLHGHIALARENRLGVMLALGKSYLHDGRVETMKEIMRKIEAVTAEKILETANLVFDESQLSSLIYRPD